MRKGFATSAVVLLIIGILTGAAVVILIPKIFPNLHLSSNVISKIQSPSLLQTDISNWKTYTSEKMKFSIKYPDDWIMLSCEQEREYVYFAYSKDTLIANCKSFEGDISSVRIVTEPNYTFDGYVAELRETPKYKQYNPQYNDQELILKNRRAVKAIVKYSNNNFQGLQIIYIIDTPGNKVLNVVYSQFQAMENVEKEFGLMLSTLEFQD